MSVLFISLGLMVIAAVLGDVIVTALTVGGGGPITSRLSHGIWHVALWLHQRHPHHRCLQVMGWVILVSVALLWIVGIWVGWSLIFCAVDSAVINSQSKVPANFWERVYFVGFTLSTLGLGDYQARGGIWQIATVIAAANGFLLVSLSISYLLPVVSAAAQGGQLAAYITAMGGTPDDILARAWNGRDFGNLDQHLISLSPLITQSAEQYLAYPVLHYFHAIDRSRAVALSLVALDEALTLLQYGVEPSKRPDPATLQVVRRATTAFLQVIHSAYIEPASEDPPLPSLELLRVEGIPTLPDPAFRQAIEPIAHRRRLLLGLLQNDGWQWDAIASRKTTSRGSTLDDPMAFSA